MAIEEFTLAMCQDLNWIVTGEIPLKGLRPRNVVLHKRRMAEQKLRSIKLYTQTFDISYRTTAHNTYEVPQSSRRRSENV
jgi:hypothetical protein